VIDDPEITRMLNQLAEGARGPLAGLLPEVYEHR
jgi:hypothetical protein